jgi:hypothetical protein
MFAGTLVAFIFILALGGGSVPARGATNETDTERYLGGDLDMNLSPWDHSFHLRSAVGYDDNVTLSDADQKASGFVDNGVDITIFRLPLDDWEFEFLLSGDDIRYWQNPGVSHEDTWLASTTVKRNLGENWKAAAVFNYVYINQIVDLFDFIDNIHMPPGRVEGHRFELRPSLQRKLGEDWSVTMEADGIRQFLSYPADSDSRAGSRLTLANTSWRGSEFALSYAAWEMWYDHETDLNPDGSTIPNTSLRGVRQEATLSWNRAWDARKRWHTGAKLDFNRFQDNSTGYYNFNEYAASGQIRYTGAKWTALCSARIAYDAFPNQPVSYADLASRLHRALLTGEVRVERRVLKKLKVFVDYQNSTGSSDSPDEVYHANTVMAGVDWEL